MSSVLIKHEMLWDPAATHSSLMLIHSALQLLRVLSHKRIFNIRSMWMIVWMVRVLNCLRVQSCWREDAVSSAISSWGRAGISDFFTEFARTTHLSALERHLNERWWPSKGVWDRRMKHGIASRAEILMMACTGCCWQVRSLETCLLAQIVFFVWNTGTSVGRAATHDWRRGRTHTSILWWMLLVTFQGKRTERSYIGNSFVLVGEILVTVGSSSTLSSWRLIFFDLGGSYMLTECIRRRVHGRLAGCSAMCVQRRQGQSTTTAPRVNLWCKHSELRCVSLMLMMLE